MKFSLFVHMERFDPAKPHADLLDELVELVEIAEAGGMVSAWIGEHHGMEFTIAPNPFVYLAYLAPRTSRIRLGTATVIAPFWQPLRLAGEAAIVDIMTKGRLDVGLSRGAYQFEFDRLAGGMKGTEGGRHLREMVPALKGLWQGDYAHEGDCYSFPASTSVPKPLQSPHPPLWIAARDPESHNFAVSTGCNVMVTPLSRPDEEIESLAAKFGAAVERNPQVPRPKLLLLKHTHVHDAKEGWEPGARALRRYYSHFESWFRNEAPVERGFRPPLDESELASRPDYALDAVRSAHLIGTPDEVIPRLQRYAALGIDEYSIWIDNGMDHAAKKKCLTLFIDEVMPAFA